MTRANRVALLLSISTFLLVTFVSRVIFENIPHIEDEMTYVWQARVYTRFQNRIPTPGCSECFLVPFVIDNEGYRYSKYPPGWPAVLSLGMQLHVRDYVNPLLAALSVWLMYRLAARFLKPWTAVFAAFLLVSSPLFLMNSGSLLSHTWSLVLALAFIISWLHTWEDGRTVSGWLTVTTSATCLGLLILTRPLTAFAVSLPFIVHGLILWFSKHSSNKKLLALFIAITSLFTILYLVWQYDVSGSLFTNPYQLYWPYDRIGFGPDIGLNPDGHTLKHAIDNTLFSLSYGSSDLYGWPNLSWLFIIPGIIALLNKPKALMVSAVFPVIILIYALYWIGSWILGPRYYFEGLIGAVLLTAAGIEWSLNISKKYLNVTMGKKQFSAAKLLIAMVSIGLITYNLVLFLPQRLEGLKGLYGISASQLTFFKSEVVQKLAPALIIIHPIDNWLEYGALLDISSPFLDSPIVVSYNRGSELNQQAADFLPDRLVLHYYPTMFPETLYRTPFPSIQMEKTD